MIAPHVADCLCPACATAHQPVTDYEMADAMLTYGGSFVQCLGKLYMHADERNRARILATWPNECGQYRDLVRLKREQAKA